MPLPIPLSAVVLSRLRLAVFLAVAIAAVFWGEQRYPALLKKLHAGQSLKVSGAISFDALLPVAPGMPLPERVGRTSVNWLWTNRFGMYFALPFGAAIMTLLARTRRPRRFEHAAANVLCGAVAGAPLGVCTNCATPIGQSLLVSGASTRLTVAAMISSPSFNPVVVAMAFVLFPWQMAAARVIVPALVLLLLPLLVSESRPALKSAIIPDWTGKPQQAHPVCLVRFPPQPAASHAAHLAVDASGRRAGGPGSRACARLWDPLCRFRRLGVVAVAVLGTLLPVPMAFDVGLAWVLYRAGVPAAYVTTLLCTLGVVSIYSLTALGQQLGRAAVLRLGGAVALLGAIAGFFFLWS